MSGGEEIDLQISEVKLKRVQELNIRLKESLQRSRISTSRASFLTLDKIQSTPDHLIPYIWKSPPELNKFQKYEDARNKRIEESVTVACCNII